MRRMKSEELHALWRAWSFWKPALKETSAAAAAENVVGNKTLSYAVHFWS